MSQNHNAPAFIATLGLSPQVITRALDELLETESQFGIVSIIHTEMFDDDHPQWRSLAAFNSYIQSHYDVKTRLIPIQDDTGRTIRDIRTREDTTYVYKTIQEEMKSLKHEFGRIHALIAGGRKSMVVYTMIAAQFIFDNNDKLWHLFSIEKGDAAHEPNENMSHLVEVPVVLALWVSPVVRQLVLNNHDLASASDAYEQQKEIERLAHLNEFYTSKLNDEERGILQRLRAFKMEKQIGYELNLDKSTLSRRIEAICKSFVEEFPEYRLPGKPGLNKILVLIALDPILSSES